FDFDGLLVDTETPAFESWRMLYAGYGHDLTLDLWQGALGTSHGFDPLDHLETLLGRALDRAADLERRRALKAAMSADQPLLPGARDLLEQARALDIPCAIASSSDRAWVEGWLRRHAIYDAFVCVRTADDVALTKPAPELFLSAAACLGAPPGACLVFEDSPNGILAARAAGMRCVAVPGAVTSRLALPPADLVIRSLDAMPLAEIIAKTDR
ncbi:MAG TPA: HAD family hydrolase, partial [Roseiflexaceae bacterium]